MCKTINHKQNVFKFAPVCAAVLLAFGVQTAQANPVGAAVVNGQASFASTANTLTVTNTPGTIINWQGFSIQQNEITRFAQQSASSTVLNRVVTNNPSQILGTLQSNGRVFLVNPNGIIFGAGSTVDVAGLVATTLNLSNADFLAGRHNFTQVPGAANISNAGNLTAQSGGEIYLIAPNVENTGIITAPNGDILLAAGHEVQLVNSLDPNLRVNITAPAGDATNVGQLVASAGRLGLFGTVVKNSGNVSADSATLQGGKIVFKASQRAVIGGTVSATGTSGGAIQALGNEVQITAGAALDASGTQGGGTILVGGDAHGNNTSIQNAANTFVASTAQMHADAIQHGNGGKVIVWANDTTLMYGNASARGGAQGGNGGFVETSGKRMLSVTNPADVSAPKGNGGTWLLDPFAITVVSTPTAGTLDTSNPNFVANAAVSTVTNTVIQGALSMGTNVVLDTSAGTCGTCNITVNAPITALLPVTGATLTMNAADNIIINQPITATGGALNLALNHGATGSATVANTLSLFGGSVDVGNYGLTGIVTPGAGSIIFTGGATALTGNLSTSNLSMSGGTLNLNGVAPTALVALNMNSGYLSTAAPVTASSLAVTGGTLMGSGGYTVTGATTFAPCTNCGVSFYVDGTTLNTQGAVSQTVNGTSSANVYLANAAVINNTGTWTLNNLNLYQGAGTLGNFNNQGTAGVVNVTGNSRIDPLFNDSSTAANSLNVTAGTLTLGGGGTSSSAFNVATGAGLTFTNWYGTNAFNLTGATGITGAGTLTFTNWNANTVNVTGTVAANSITNSGATTTLSGALTVPTLSVSSGTLNVNSGATATTLSSLTMGGGALNLNGSAATSLTTFAMNGGTLSVAAPVTASSLAVTGGTLMGSGGYTVTGATTFAPCTNCGVSFYVDGTTLNTQGAVSQTVNGTSSANVYLANAAVINNTGTWTLNNLNLYQGAGTLGNFNNQGTAGVVNVTGNSRIDPLFNDSSTAANSLNVTAGTLTLGGGGTSSSAFNVATGAGLTFTNWYGTNAFNLTGATGITGAGTLTFTNWNANTVNVTGTVAANSITNSGATTTLSGALTVPTLSVSSGTLNVNSGATATTLSSLTMGGGALNLNGSAATSLTTFAMNGGTLSVAAPVTASSLAVTGGTLMGSGGYTVTGATTFAPCTNCGVSFYVDGTTLNTQGAVSQTVNGTSSANVYLANAAVINNTGTWTLNNLNLYQGAGTLGNFNNQGTAGVVNVTGNSRIDPLFNDSSTAANSLNVTAGTLTLGGGGTSSSAFNVATGAGLTFTNWYGTNAFNLTGATGITGAGTLTFTNWNANTVNVTGTVAANSITNSGATTTLSGALTVPTLSVSSGTLNLGVANSVTTFNMSGGTLNTSGLLTAGTLNWTTGGTLAGTGGYAVSSALNLQTSGCANCGYGLYLSGTTLTNNGVATMGGGLGVGAARPDLYLNNGAVINNAATKSWNLNYANIYNNGGTGVNAFNNAGTLTTTAALAGNGGGRIDAVFSNNGTVNLPNSGLTLGGGGTSSGTFNLATGSSLFFTNYVGNDTAYNLTNAAPITGIGDLTFTSWNANTVNVAGTIAANSITNSGATTTLSGALTVPTLSVSSGTLNLGVANSVTTFNMSGGTLNTSGLLTAGTLNWTTGGTLAGTGGYAVSSALNLQTSGCANCGYGLYLSGTTLTNNGVATMGGGLGTGAARPDLYLNNGAVIDNAAASTWNFNYANIYNNGGTGVNAFNNAGTLTTTAALAGNGGGRIDAVFSNSGTVTLPNSGLTLGGGGTSSGTFNLATGSSMVLTNYVGNNTAFNLTGITGAGDLTFTSWNANTVNVAGTIAANSITNSGAATTVTGALTVPTITVSSGTLAFRVPNGANSIATLAMNGGTLDSFGSLTIGTLTMAGNGTSTLTGAGSYTVTGSMTFLPTLNAIPLSVCERYDAQHAGGRLTNQEWDKFGARADQQRRNDQQQRKLDPG